MASHGITLGVAAIAALSGQVAAAQSYGLDARPDNTSCIAPARPVSASNVSYQDAFPGAPDFVEPVKIMQAPSDASRWFVLEKAGRVRTFSTANPAAVTTWLDISSRVVAEGDGGLLGMAFHPDYPATREVYLYYTAPASPMPMVSTISRFILDDVTAPVDPVEQVLLTVDQPYTNHKGGDIAFGPDRYLYIGLGDGGSGGDPEDHGEDTTDLLGSMLRIDVVGVPFSERYRIPSDNPFSPEARCGPGSNPASCPEIYAWGTRNPWRWSFDKQTGALWAADVGQSQWEEIDLIERGGDYGWRCREGAHAYNTAGCSTGGYVDPVFEYSHAVGASITGGFVYRGNAIPGLRGRYIFGDFVSGWVAALQDDGAGGYARDELFDADHQVSAFGQGSDGEIYFADFGTGRFQKLVPTVGGTVETVPANLRDTGCVNAADPAQPAPGLIPYGINAPFWSDGAAKDRWLALPNGGVITIDGQNDWILPPRSVLMKNFRLNGRLVETRLLMRHTDGMWRGYTYEWNDAQTAATRVIGGKSRLVDGQTWIYPSEGQCLQCHTSAAGFSLGLETAQMNRDFVYPSTGRSANQLGTLAHIGMFAAPLAAPPEDLPRLADPADATAPLGSRSRAWLHANCANCHRPGGLTPVDLDLRHSTPLQAMKSCNVAPTAGTLGLAGARRIVAGASGNSVLSARTGRRDAWAMPPLATSLVDVGGADVVAAWIDGLASCQDSDFDNVDDARDNCIADANASQVDSDNDGYGNRCDGDFDNSGSVSFNDVALFRTYFGTAQPEMDLNDDGTVNFSDMALLRAMFGTGPGPSAAHP